MKRTLSELKSVGEVAWIGSCCEAFYEKHFDDFKEIELPGLIVTTDGVTCYDVGQEELAYEGRYEGSSKLRVNLLMKVLRFSSKLKKQASQQVSE